MTRRRIVPALLTVLCLAVLGAAGCAGSPTWEMPDVVGVDLQSAQDTVQVLTSFGVPVTSHDRTGANRMQVVDEEWRVCDQTPEAGTDLTEDSMIDLGVVRRDEDC
ncbi:PASTA domain-containing protein [Pseudonocardia broussonetiae]|uniref:PASTA domain-containing protein n=1 Tax=Pseudonocardia broussonetiae TaxID=2736640 RepID=A0A6M6J9I0_9PSEU|nr:hypothetical protein [Pseudonocardia broussonetiae]QJY44438.1 hypothetical protein HOP40_00095 [Pseudonocardia broussonetiae]